MATPVAFWAAIGSSLKKNKAKTKVVKEAINLHVIDFNMALSLALSLKNMMKF